jgi:hypothetical protein
MTLNDEFPLLRALGVLEGEKSVHDYIMAGIVNTTASSAYTLHTATIGEHTYHLRIVGLGDGCYFAWIDDQCQIVGTAFHRLEVGEESRLKSQMNLDLAKSA